MTFDEWWQSLGVKERPFGTAYEIIARKAWEAATKHERERAALVCDDEARIRTDAGRKHVAESAEQGRCFAGARAAINCARGVRSGEEFPTPAPTPSPAPSPETPAA